MKITTEDPANDFVPGTGTIESYRSRAVGAFDESGFSAAITPFCKFIYTIGKAVELFEITIRKASQAFVKQEIKGVRSQHQIHDERSEPSNS